MKELNKKQVNETEVIVKKQGESTPEQSEPSQKQIIDGLAQQVVAYDKQNKELQQALNVTEKNYRELQSINAKLNEEIKAAHEEIKLLNERLEAPKQCDCCCEPHPYQGLNTPWETKMNEMYSHLEAEEHYYVERIKEIKHRNIEFPEQPANEMNLKFCKQHLKKIRKIKKAILK